MATGAKSITLTHADSGDTFNLTDGNIIYVFSDTLGAKIVYESQAGSYRKEVVVTESPSTIKSNATILFTVSPLTGSDFEVSVNRVLHVEYDQDSIGGSRSLLVYDNNGSLAERIQLDQSKSTVQTNINAL